jgi:hypothetical protein
MWSAMTATLNPKMAIDAIPLVNNDTGRPSMIPVNVGLACFSSMSLIQPLLHGSHTTLAVQSRSPCFHVFSVVPALSYWRKVNFLGRFGPSKWPIHSLKMCSPLIFAAR